MRAPLAFLLLPLFYAARAQDCPDACDCLPDPLTDRGQLITCRWPQLPVVSGLSNTTHSLTLICQGPSVLPEAFFASLPELRSLRIENCSTTHVPAPLFEPLTNLRSLELHKMSLGRPLLLPEEVFSGLKKLEKLSLTECELESLPSDLFCSLSNLQVLNVSSNRLTPTGLRSNAECAADLLIIADLSSNALAKLATDSLRALPAVRQLLLNDNGMEEIEDRAFAATPLLQQLQLHDNQLTSLEWVPETLVHVTLSRNRLQSLPASVAALPKLVSLEAAHNDLIAIPELKSTDLESVELAGNRLIRAPTDQLNSCADALTALDLDDNLISELDEKQFENFTRLHTLRLGSNGVTSLPSGLLSGMAQLKHLSLNNNSLTLLSPTALTGLRLTSLDLSHNMLTEVPHALAGLNRLEKIDLRHNRISRLTTFVLNKILNLEEVRISDNEIVDIPSHAFSDSAHLALLDISRNRVVNMARDAFTKCPQLRRLDLAENRIADLGDSLVPPSGVRRVNVSSNSLQSVSWSGLPARLEHLIADHNDISHLGAAGKSRLRVVSLSHNQLDGVSGEQLPDSLEHLDLSHNIISLVSVGALREKRALKTLDLTWNRLPMLEQAAVSTEGGAVRVLIEGNPLECACQLDWVNDGKRVVVADVDRTTCRHAIDGRRLKLTEVTDKQLLCEYEQVCEPSCICCQYGNCDCKAVCPAGCRCLRDSTFNTNIVMCDRLNETAAKAFSPRDIPMSATHVSISRTPLGELKSHSFLGRSRLLQLRLNHTQLEKIHPKAFNTLANLQLLDLSDNALSEFSGEELHRTARITHLFLNNNQLERVNETLTDKLPQLQMMTLHSNRLADTWPQLARLLSVSLAENPFRCDCSDRFASASWISEHRDKVVDAASVMCVENVTEAFRNNDTTILSAHPPNYGGGHVFRMHMDEFVREANRSLCVPLPSGVFGVEPRSSFLLLCLLLAAVLLAVGSALLGAALLRRTRDAMKQRRYKSSSLNCSSSPGSSPLPAPLIQYDAFVSYSHKDEKLVVEQLCRPLEEEDVQLCLLHRDGPPLSPRVHSVSDDLIHQMDAAQCLLLVLTKNFLHNEWRTLQIKTSHQLLARQRARRVIAVLGEGVDSNALDGELGAILRKNTIIRIGDPLFWNLLRAALPPKCRDNAYAEPYGIVPSAMV